MTRKRLTTITDADQFSNRDLLLDIALKLHELDGKVDRHLYAHGLLNKVLAVCVPIIASAIVALYLRK